MDTCSEGKVVAAINGVTDAGVPEEGTRVGPTRETRVCGADAGPVRAGHAEREAAHVDRQSTVSGVCSMLTIRSSLSRRVLPSRRVTAIMGIGFRLRDQIIGRRSEIVRV